MNSFVDRFNRFRVVLFSILASLLCVSFSLFLFSSTLSKVIASVLSSLVFSAYFFLGRTKRFDQKTRYLVRTIPVLLVLFVVAFFLLSGFFVFLSSAPSVSLPDTDAFSLLPKALFLVVLCLGLALPLFIVLALRDMVFMFRAHHKVANEEVVLFTRRVSWRLTPNEYFALVVGEDVVLGCKVKGDIAQAVDFVNKPLKQSLFAKVLDGAYYVATEKLIRDCRTSGYKVAEEKRAFIVWLS